MVQLCKSLKLWQKKIKFLGNIHLGIITGKEYLVEIEKFKSNFKDFYVCGKKTFHSQLGMIGYGETFFEALYS